MTLVASALAGGDCIDDAELWLPYPTYGLFSLSIGFDNSQRLTHDGVK